MSASATSTSWSLQRSTRAKGWYYQAVHGRGRSRRAVTLGYMTDSQADDAMAMLRSWGDRLLTVDEFNEPLLSNKQIKEAVLNDHPGQVEQVLRAVDQGMARQLIASGDLSRMRLTEFVDLVWMPVRRQEAAPKTVQREVEIWKVIKATLGHIPMSGLSMARWTRFLNSRDTWSGRTRSIAQNAYRCSLRYSVEVGAIEEVHSFRPIKGSTKPSRPPAEPLTLDEVPVVLDAARSHMHRALFAFAIGQGLRPGEATALEWQDIDWEGRLVLIRGSKTELSRQVVPMTPLAHRELMAFWMKEGQPSSGVAFTWAGKPIKLWRNAFITACRKAGITRRVHPYLARHTFATLSVAAGANPAAIRAMMRHTKRSTILEQAYTRLNPDQVRAGMAAFPSFGSEQDEPEAKQAG